MNRGNAKKPVSDIRYMTMTAMLSAVAYVLMMLEFSIPIMPPFIKMDLSELPALIGSFSMGPVSGVVICLIKNLLHLPLSTTGGVGELSNFILGALFVAPAGILYRIKKGRKYAFIGSMIGAVIMSLVSVASNYFIVYPFYTAFMPMKEIINAYQIIYPKADTLLKCLVIFNMPFTFVKGLLNVLITFLIYKHISPIIKGTQSK
ncbi:MAG: ECF transporter S component [Lachnospiraceae bacterium]|nr:ECF transporter S component [Lachnospiraceae bacterium]